MKDRSQAQSRTPESLFAGAGFGSLTEIQARACPKILQKRDCLVVAPTGSGKTECSVIPVFSLLSRSSKPGRIRAVYVTPLRALNRDVFRRITGYAHAAGLDIAVRHGDTPQRERRRINSAPPDVLITTPETLVVLLTQPGMLLALSELEWVVIDEVHELLASERGSQLALSLERLQLNSRLPLTRIGLSATVGNVGEAAKFVVGTKRRCEIVRDSSVREYDVEIRYVKGTISDVAQQIADHVRPLAAGSPVLLFANTRGEAELLASVLSSKSGMPVELHHGSLSREVREEAEQSLREGRGGIVVCTSSLELGLDLGSVELVIHYGSPRQVSKFVQRIGRSRHRRGLSARGLIITNSPDDEFEARAILDRIREGSIEEQPVHRGPLDVLAHHLVGLAMQSGRIRVDHALRFARQAYPFRGLRLDELTGVLELLDANYLVDFDREGMSFRKKGGSFRYHYENLSTIPDILRFRVFDSVGKRAIGSLDQRFVGDNGDPGSVFVLKGSQWRILNVDEKSFTVNVEPCRGGGTNVPYWEGESIPIDYKTASRVGRFRTMAREGSLEVANGVIDGLDIGGVPGESAITVESNRAEGSVVVHSCFGTRANSTLATLLSSMLSSLLGSAVDSRSDAYRIALSSRSRISERTFMGVLKDEYDLPSVIGASIAGTHNVNWRTWCVAKKFGIVGRGAIYERKAARFLYERYSGTPLVDEALRELFHDKYDLGACAGLLGRIRDGSIGVTWTEVSRFSRLAEPILDHTARYYSSPASLDRGILDMVRARLEKTRHRLVCARCGRWEMALTTAEVTGPLACPYCRGRQITATFHSDYDLPKIIRRNMEGGRLTAEERRRLARAWKVSSLVENFGRTAIVVMSGYGVGADTAARILRNMVDEDHLYRQIYEAERQYVVTRGFWD